MSTTPPGWYHDPWSQAPMRWWDGSRWTEHLADWRGHLPAVPTPGPSLGGPALAVRIDAERRITPWLRRLLYLWPLAAAASVGVAAASIQPVIDAFNGDSTNSTSGWGAVAQVAGAISIVLLVLRMVWLHRAVAVARDLGLPVRRQPLPAAIGWLVPIINLWWPLQGLTDLFVPGHRPDRRLAWWWACSVVSSLAPLAGLAVPYVPVLAAAAIVVAAVVPTVAAAILELGLVSDAVALHTRLATPA